MQPHTTYDPERDVTPAFLGTVGQWIQEGAEPEIFVVLRYLRAGGAKHYAFIKSAADFAALVACVPDGTDIIVFRDPQLPLRGKVTPEFLARAMDHVRDGEEYMFVRMAPDSRLPAGDLRRSGEFDNSHAELARDWEYETGEEVAFGICPDFMDRDHDRMISASKGGIDGAR
ncbi:MAG TPA: hypothetical protein VGE67_12750 [Haloferula sp.]